jgi:hypothetical protein
VGIAVELRHRDRGAEWERDAHAAAPRSVWRIRASIVMRYVRHASY